MFNPKLRDGTYVPKGEVLETLNTWRAKSPKTRSPSCSAVSSCISFFRNSLALIRDFPGAVFAARRTVATDEGLVRNIYASFLDENASSNALQPAMLDPQWAWFRWVQCQLLAALRIFQRYQYRIPDPPTPNVLLKAEHSMHDLDYVLLASLAGGIATNDTEVEKDFRLVHPDGRVLSFRSK